MPKSLFLNYLRHNEINEYLDSLAASHPELVTVSECGQSYEGRTIKSVKISYTNFQAKKTNTSPDNPIQIKTRKAKTFSKAAGEPRKRLKPNNANNKSTILIDGGIHGREWMSVATAVYCIHELIEHFDKNKSMLEKLDFVIVPIVNVDGYEYSHTNVGITSFENNFNNFVHQFYLMHSFHFGEKLVGHRAIIVTGLVLTVIVISITNGRNFRDKYAKIHIQARGHSLNLKRYC